MATKATKTKANKGKSSMKTKSRTLKKSNIKSTRRFPLWSIILLIAFIAGIGIYLVYRSYAAGPNLRFQILKDSTCTNSIPANTNVNIRISRTTGNEPISNITVYVDGSPVSTSPNSINGPVLNLMVAQPTLSATPANHTITVRGIKQSAQVQFSPYCEATGSTNSTVSVTNTNPGTPGGTPGGSTGQRLSAYLTPAQLAAGYVAPGTAESSSPIYGTHGERPGTVFCIQGTCSYNFFGGDPGTPFNTLIRPQWNCTNGSGWAYKPTGKNPAVWPCTVDYSIARDPVIRPWVAVASCESGGNWGINTGNGYYGGLQFTLATWQSVGGQGYPHQNSAHEQALRAEILRQRSGLGQWPQCGPPNYGR